MSHDQHIPDWELALYRLGELQPARASALSQRLNTDPELAARLAALDPREAELMVRVPPRVLEAAVADRVEQPAKPRRRLRRRLLFLTAEIALVALLLVLFMPPILRPDQIAEFEEHNVRSKGVDPFLRIYRKVPEGLEELSPDDPVGAGDRLQMAYSAMGCVHGAVLSVDGRGAVTLHHPTQGTLSAELQPQGTVDLPVSYVLDNAPDFERFFLVTGPEPFELTPVLEAARALAAHPGSAHQASIALPRGLDGYDFLLSKP